MPNSPAGAFAFCIAVALVWCAPSRATPSAGCGASALVPPDGAIYHPGDYVDAEAHGIGNAQSEYWGQGAASLYGYGYGQNNCSLWPTIQGEGEINGGANGTASGAGFVNWSLDVWAESHASTGRTVEWEDIQEEPHWAACVGHGDAAATDPDGTQDPPEVIRASASQFWVRDWGPGPPPGGGEGQNLGDVIAPSERS